MTNFNDIIKKIEEHTGEDFDYSNRMHKFHLKESVNRELKTAHRIQMNVAKALEGHSTFDPATHKSILRSDRKRD